MSAYRKRQENGELVHCGELKFPVQKITRIGLQSRAVSSTFSCRLRHADMPCRHAMQNRTADGRSIYFHISCHFPTQKKVRRCSGGRGDRGSLMDLQTRSVHPMYPCGWMEGVVGTPYPSDQRQPLTASATIDWLVVFVRGPGGDK